MKILLILASDLVYRYKNIFSINNGFAPLSLTTIAASVPDKYNAEIRIIDEGMQKVNYDKLNYDIVGISCCASSSNRAYELSEYWQKRGAYTIIGGHHATLNSDEVSKHCNSVICGFGEYVFPQMLEDYLNNCTKKIYNATCLENTQTVLPRRDLIKHIPYYAKNTTYATRGCINNCSYCSVSKFTNSKHIKRPVNEIVDEIKQNKFRKVYFMDSNFVADKDYAKEVMKALIPLKISYYADVTSDSYQDFELMDLMQKSGCFQVFIGFETLNHLNSNCASKIEMVKNYKDCITSFHDKNISITGAFMLGMDYDTEDSIKLLPEQIADYGVDLVRYTVFTPLPGTKTYSEYLNQDRLLTLNYDFYDFMHVVHKPKFISPERLQLLYHNIWKETYSYKNIINRVKYIKNQKIDLLLQNLYFKHLGKSIPSKYQPNE